MKINGKNFKVYLSDTVDTIKDRISISLNTLPQYLVFEPELESPVQSGDLVVVNALAPVLKSTEMKFPEDMINFDKVSREEAERFFIATHNINTTVKNDTEMDAILSFVITGLTTLNAQTIWKDRVNIKQKMKTKIDKLRKEVDDTVKLFEEFENIPSIDTVEYEVSTVRFNIRFDSTSQGFITVAELFNSITVTKTTPYANMGSFYKVFHDFVPNIDWLELETPNVILLKVDGENTSNDFRQFKNKYRKYTDAAFTIVNNEIIATLTMNVGDRNVCRDVFISRVLETFPNLNISMITRIDEKSTGGFITYPRQTILIPIWAELCMNNPFFNRIVALNETIRASKIKMNAYMHVIDTNDILSISMKETDKANMYGMEDEGSNFIRVRVKATTITDSLKYQKILGRLFTLYNNNRDLILAEYRIYIGPKFLRTEESKLIVRPRKLEKLELRVIAPEIFLPTYSRKCLKRPTIINREQANHYRRTNEKQVIEFPIHGESIKRYYVCEHETHPFPGLRDNTLENKKKFPYIPCCYTKDQNREGSKFRYYYTQEKMREKNSAVQDIFISGKTLPPGLPGTLPPNIQELFSLIEPNPKYQFVRVGSNVTNSSLLECVMIALNVHNIQFLKVDDRIPVVERMRLEIATEANAMAAKQEFYDYPVASILEKLVNSNLNALEFGHVLEMVFNCNIFVLSSNDKNPSGTMIIPRHAKAYYKMKPTHRTVFIYQHEIEDSTEIQCELITRTKTPDTKVLNNMDTSFSYFDKVVMRIWEIFRDINRSFSHNTMLPSISIPILNVKSQIVDIYGKCRVLNIDFNGVMITMVSDPLPPYNANKATNVYRASLATLKDFARVNKVVFTKQRVKGTTVREVTAIMSNMNLIVTFLCNDVTRLNGVLVVTDPEEYDAFLKTDVNTIVSHFNHNKKIAKIIYQYGLYFMSQFMHMKGYTTEQLNEKQLLQFIEEHTIIKPDHNFTSRNLSSKYSIDSQFVDERKKVITTSKEMLVRLIYMLRLYQNTHFDEIIGYKDRIHIEGFYDEISDFDESPYQFVLDSPGAVQGLVDSYKIDNTVTHDVRIDHEQPYFIYNNIIGDQIYLVQNVSPVYEEIDGDKVEIKSGQQVAVELVKCWDQYGYNAYFEGPFEIEDDKHVNIYSYVNAEDIINLTKYIDAIPGMVLGYLVNGEALYTALMPL